MKKLHTNLFQKQISHLFHSNTARLSSPCIQSIPILPNGALQSFCDLAFHPARPHLLPRGHFASLPAIHKWFEPSLSPTTHDAVSTVNIPYLTPHGNTTVPLELTRPAAVDSQQPSFERFEAPLTFFLTYLQTRREATPEAAAAMPNLYLAQAPLSSLPAALCADLATPDFVLRAGRGDVYDSSIWIGPAPTFTPLHRDPNPNLFVQLAGRKRVRLLAPDVGQEVFASVKARVRSGSGNEKLRGEEMMMGDERSELEEEMWGSGEVVETHGYEAELGPGDGLFIPLGWWHSVQGVGRGIVGSVNWWFR